MDKQQATQLANLLNQARHQRSWSFRDVAESSGITKSNVIRLEQGVIPNPRPETLKALADALGLDLADLYAAAGYTQPKGLPSFKPYLRSRYPGLPATAKRELADSFARIAAKHGYDARGPQLGEDETE